MPPGRRRTSRHQLARFPRKSQLHLLQQRLENEAMEKRLALRAAATATATTTAGPAGPAGPTGPVAAALPTPPASTNGGSSGVTLISESPSCCNGPCRGHTAVEEGEDESEEDESGSDIEESDDSDFETEDEDEVEDNTNNANNNNNGVDNNLTALQRAEMQLSPDAYDPRFENAIDSDFEDVSDNDASSAGGVLPQEVFARLDEKRLQALRPAGSSRSVLTQGILQARVVTTTAAPVVTNTPHPHPLRSNPTHCSAGFANNNNNNNNGNYTPPRTPPGGGAPQLPVQSPPQSPGQAMPPPPPPTPMSPLGSVDASVAEGRAPAADDDDSDVDSTVVREVDAQWHEEMTAAADLQHRAQRRLRHRRAAEASRRHAAEAGLLTVLSPPPPPRVMRPVVRNGTLLLEAAGPTAAPPTTATSTAMAIAPTKALLVARAGADRARSTAAAARNVPPPHQLRNAELTGSLKEDLTIEQRFPYVLKHHGCRHLLSFEDAALVRAASGAERPPSPPRSATASLLQNQQCAAMNATDAAAAVAAILRRTQSDPPPAPLHYAARHPNAAALPMTVTEAIPCAGSHNGRAQSELLCYIDDYEPPQSWSWGRGYHSRGW